MNSIEIKNISKSYKDVQALYDVSLKFEGDKIYGLLGRNGAGKSTLLNIISNRIFTDEGSITINGENAFENDKAGMLYYLMSEENCYPPSMKISEAFKWSKEFYENFDINYANKLAEQFALNTSKKVKALSTGYSSIFKLIIALSVNTPFVLLDEPVLGLDANHRDLFYKVFLEKYNEKPFTAVISTHLIEEVASLIENTVIIKQGQIIYDEPCETLLKKGYTVAGPSTLVDSYIANKKPLSVERLGGLASACILGTPDENLPQGLEPEPLDLQKFFIALTNI